MLKKGPLIKFKINFSVVLQSASLYVDSNKQTNKQRKFFFFNLKKLNIMFFFILPIMQKPSIPARWTFFGEKETIEESNEPSLIKVR